MPRIARQSIGTKTLSAEGLRYPKSALRPNAPVRSLIYKAHYKRGKCKVPTQIMYPMDSLPAEMHERFNEHTVAKPLAPKRV